MTDLAYDQFQERPLSTCMIFTHIHRTFTVTRASYVNIVLTIDFERLTQAEAAIEDKYSTGFLRYVRLDYTRVRAHARTHFR